MPNSTMGDVVMVTNQLPTDDHVHGYPQPGHVGQSASKGSVPADGHALAKHDNSGSVGNSVMLSTVSDLDIAKASKPHHTADELKKAEDDNKAEVDDGPMSPFFMYLENQDFINNCF